MTAVIPESLARVDSGCVTTNPQHAEGYGPFGRFRSDHAQVLGRIAVLDGLLTLEKPIDELQLPELLTHLGLQFATHLAAEDRVLFPVLSEAFPEGRGTLASLHDDHVELRGMLAALGKYVDQPSSSKRDEQVGVLLRDFIDLLRLHIHKEESAVFDVASRVLSPTEVDAVASRLSNFLDVRIPEGAPNAPEKGLPS